MISRDPSEALQVLVHVFEGLGRYTDPGLPGKSGSRGFKVVENECIPALPLTSPKLHFFCASPFSQVG